MLPLEITSGLSPELASELAHGEIVEGYATDLEAAEALRIIQSRTWTKERPFFVYLAWHAPRECMRPLHHS